MKRPPMSTLHVSRLSNKHALKLVQTLRVLGPARPYLPLRHPPRVRERLPLLAKPAQNRTGGPNLARSFTIPPWLQCPLMSKGLALSWSVLHILQRANVHIGSALVEPWGVATVVPAHLSRGRDQRHAPLLHRVYSPPNLLLEPCLTATLTSFAIMTSAASPRS